MTTLAIRHEREEDDHHCRQICDGVWLAPALCTGTGRRHWRRADPWSRAPEGDTERLLELRGSSRPLRPPMSGVVCRRSP